MDNSTSKKFVLDPRTKIIAAVMALIIIVLIIVLVMPKKATINTPVTNNTSTENQTNTASTSETAIGTSTLVKDKFREEVPQNTVVPNKETVLTEAEKKEIALPTVVTPAAPGVEAQFRSFDIKAEGGVFTPSKIIANLGDTIHVNFTAVDKTYDITFPSYNMKQTAKAGQTKILEFQAVSEGSFLYYCDSCGGENSTTKGSVIIVK